jgi:hypothetical protein
VRRDLWLRNPAVTVKVFLNGQLWIFTVRGGPSPAESGAPLVYDDPMDRLEDSIPGLPADYVPLFKINDDSKLVGLKPSPKNSP